MPVYNEDDIVYWSVRKYIKQGIDVLALDNHSNDSTANEAARAGATVETFGSEGHFSEVEMDNLVIRKASQSGYDWTIFAAADEVYCPPTADETYRTFVERADAAGANVINHYTHQYVPTDETFVRGDYEQHFRHWLTEDDLGLVGYRQERTFKPRVGMYSTTFMHTVDFDGKVLFGEIGIRKHYPIRSTWHGMKKLFGERFGRSIDNSFTQYLKYNEQHREGKTPQFIYSEGDPLLRHDGAA